jgi:hypothetical protein
MGLCVEPSRTAAGGGRRSVAGCSSRCGGGARVARNVSPKTGRGRPPRQRSTESERVPKSGAVDPVRGQIRPASARQAHGYASCSAWEVWRSLGEAQLLARGVYHGGRTGGGCALGSAAGTELEGARRCPQTAMTTPSIASDPGRPGVPVRVPVGTKPMRSRPLASRGPA